MLLKGYPIVYMDKSGFEADTIRSHGYAPIGKPCIDATIGKLKNVPMSSGLCMKKCYLRLSTLRQISIAIYSTASVNTR